jgi:glycosyltransferase involved in cell wall biosynthesis
MYAEMRIAAVVPAYLEQELIGKTIASMPAIIDEIIVVDDCSPDATSQVVSASPDQRVHLIRHEVNQGVGGAIITGHRKAIELDVDVMVVMAGDNQMDPAHLPDLLEPIAEGGYGFTKGNRFYSRESISGMPRHRVVGNMLMTFLTKASSGYWNIADPLNGYTAVTAAALAEVPLDQVAHRYEFENDLLIWLNIASVRATDVKIPANYGDEVSNMQMRSAAPRMMWMLFRGFWRRMWLKHMLWSFSPIALLFLAGLGALLLGCVVGLWVTVTAILGTTPTAGTTVLAVVPFFCGFILMTQALVLDIQETPD